MDVGRGSRRTTETAQLPTQEIGVSISEYKEEYNYVGVDLTKSMWYTQANTQLLDDGTSGVLSISRALSFNGYVRKYDTPMGYMDNAKLRGAGGHDIRQYRTAHI